MRLNKQIEEQSALTGRAYGLFISAKVNHWGMDHLLDRVLTDVYGRMKPLPNYRREYVRGYVQGLFAAHYDLTENRFLLNGKIVTRDEVPEGAWSRVQFIGTYYIGTGNVYMTASPTD